MEGTAEGLKKETDNDYCTVERSKALSSIGPAPKKFVPERPMVG